MIRAVTAVAMTVALAAASLPVVERAAQTHADRRVETAVERLESAARDLRARSDAAARGTGRRPVVLSLPRDTWVGPGLERLRIPPPGGGRVSWRVTGGTRHARRVLGGDLVGPPGGLTLRQGGRRRVVLHLRRDGTVEVRRRPLMSDDGTSAGHGAAP